MGFDWSGVDDGDVEIYKDLRKLAIANGCEDDLLAGYSPLYFAIHFGKSGELARLFEEVKDIDVNKLEPNYSKPIFFAVEKNSTEAFVELINRGASFENVGMLKCKRAGEEDVIAPVPILSVCCYFNRPEMADFLLRNHRDRIDIDQTHTHENRTALYAAASLGHLAVAEVLLKHGADPAIASNVLGIAVLPIEKAILRDDSFMAATLHRRAPRLTYERSATSSYSPMELALSQGKNRLAEYISRTDVVDLEPIKRPEEVTVAEMERDFVAFEAVQKERGVISNAVAVNFGGASLGLGSVGINRS